jgi:DNA-binding GntR family transcriptional regulator
MPNTVSKKEKAYQAIRQAIIIRQLAPAKNYSITELSEAFEVGKTPAREALVILASEGFIDPIPRSGYQVKSLSNRKGYDLNLEFHLTIARASGNNRLVKLVEKLLNELERVLAYYIYIAEPHQHAEILEGLKRRDKLDS